MALQFWKFLSLLMRQVAFPAPDGLDRTTVCRHRVPLYVVLSAEKGTSHWMREKPPFTLMKAHSNRREFVNGFLLKVWKIMEKRIGFSTEWFTPLNMTWNEATANGSDLLQLISRKQVDAIVSDVTVTSSTSDVTVTIPVLTYRFSVFIRQPEEDWDWKSYLEPFSLRLWLTVAGAIPALAMLLTAAQYCGRILRKEETNGSEAHFSFCNSIFYVFGAFCQQGAEVMPRAMSCRLVYCLSFATASVLLAAYSGILISVMATKHEALPFSDLGGLLQSGTYQFGVLKDAEEVTFFSGAKPNSTLYRIYSEVMMRDTKNFPETDEDGFQRVCNEKYAYMAPPDFVVSVLNEANCIVVPLPRRYFKKSLALALPAGSEYKNLINSHLRSMVNSGVLKKLREDIRMLSSSKSKPEWISVGVRHVVPLLAVLVAGIASASILLLLELKVVPAIKHVLRLCSSKGRRRRQRRRVLPSRAWLT